jgi:predicted RNA binding protein YcfA (HicA-like mRNA interferase family)
MSPRLPRVGCRELVQALKRAGFEEQRQRGSHLHMRRQSDGRRVTVPVHKGRTVPAGTLRAILRDAEISVDEFNGLLKKRRGSGRHSVDHIE